MNERTAWTSLPRSNNATAKKAIADEERLTEFRELVYRLRTETGITQAELAHRMGTTQSAIARMEAGGTRPTIDTLERLAQAIGQQLIVGVGTNLTTNRSIAKLVKDGHAIITKNHTAA